MQHKRRGFTLIELMITIVVGGLLLAVAIPSFRDFIIRNDMSTRTNQLSLALNFTRSEAVARSQIVVLCPGNADEDSCVNDWGDHESVLVFRDGNNNQTMDAGELLRVFEPLISQETGLSASVELAFTEGASGTAGDYDLTRIGYTALGQLVMPFGTPVEYTVPAAREQVLFTFEFTPDDDSDTERFPNRCINVGVTGRPSVVGEPYVDNPDDDNMADTNLWQTCQEA